MTRTAHHASRFTHYSLLMTQSVSRFTHHDLAMIIVAMLTMRLLSVMTLRVGGYVAETGPDSAYHFQLGRLAASGAYPFVNYWVEYPPFFPWLSVLAYRISALLPSWIDQRLWFNLALHGLIVPFDIGNVVLVYQLSRRVNGESLAIKSAWLYAILFTPLFVVLGWFESIALFFWLLALWAILADRPVLAGIVIGLGILVKPYVALIGAVALLIYLGGAAPTFRRSIRQLLKLIFAGAVTLLLGLLPFLLSSPQMVAAHLDTLLTLPGWSSPYALIDGVIKHVDPKVADRFDVSLATNPLVPSRIPWEIVTIAFGVIYLVILWRAIRRAASLSQLPPAARRAHPERTLSEASAEPKWESKDAARAKTARAAIGFAGLTFIFYLLWSKGYSPQWSLYLIAVLCILTPNLPGTALIAVLEALYVIEWPITFILLRADTSYLTALVIVRTTYIVGLAVFFGATIFIDAESLRWGTVKRWVRIGTMAAVSAVIALAIGALPLYAAQRYQTDPLRPAVDLIKSNATPDRANVLFDRPDTYERLAPFFPGWSSLAALQLGGAADAFSAQKIQSFSAEKPELWYVLDFGAGQKKDQREAIDRQLSETHCKISREFAGTAQVSHFVNASPDRDLNITAQFEKGLQLNGARINRDALQAGDPVCVELQWSTTAPIATDYTVFIHVLDENGNLVAQSDLQPGGGYAPTSHWPIGQPIMDRQGVVLPPALSPGTYRIVIGLYGPDGARLTSTAGADSIPLLEFTL